MVSEETVDSIIVGIGKSGNHTGNIIDFLNYTRYDFDEAFQIANEIQNMDLVKLLYSNFNQNKIIVEFTLLGKSRYKVLTGR
jgi:hypothetical protein